MKVSPRGTIRLLRGFGSNENGQVWRELNLTSTAFDKGIGNEMLNIMPPSFRIVAPQYNLFQ